jgi:hypothetical protein
MHRVTVEEASRLLGIEKESVRKRVYRGQLRADKEPDGTLRVYVDDRDGVRGPSTDDVHGHESDGVRDELVATLRDQIEHMRRESERKDAIIMQMAQANAALAARVPELEAPRNGHETPADDAGGSDPPPGHRRP